MAEDKKQKDRDKKPTSSDSDKKSKTPPDSRTVGIKDEEIKSREIKCTYCGMRFDSEYTYAFHLRETHGVHGLLDNDKENRG